MDKIDKLKTVLNAIENSVKKELENNDSHLTVYKKGQLAAVEIIREQMKL